MMTNVPFQIWNMLCYKLAKNGGSEWGSNFRSVISEYLQTLQAKEIRINTDDSRDVVECPECPDVRDVRFGSAKPPQKITPNRPHAG